MNEFIVALQGAKKLLRVYINAIALNTGISRVSCENIINGNVESPRKETARLLTMCFADELDAEIQNLNRKIDELKKARITLLGAYMDRYDSISD